MHCSVSSRQAARGWVHRCDLAPGVSVETLFIPRCLAEADGELLMGDWMRHLGKDLVLCKLLAVLQAGRSMEQMQYCQLS